MNLSTSNKSKLCICQLCTCGHHRCPHRPWGILGKGDQPCAITEYKNEYRAHDAARRQPFKPDNEFKGSGVPLSDETTHKHDYIRHPVERVVGHQPEVYRPPEGEMDTTTSYNKEFVAKQGEKAMPIRHDGMRREPAQFEGNPTYKSDYRPWDLSRTQPIKHDSGYVPSSDPFGGDSTYVNDYKRHNQAPRSAIKPDNTALQSTDPFDDRTGYREDYIKHSLPPKYQRPKDEYIQNGMPLDSLTTNRRDFTPKDAERMRSFKPDGQGYRSDAPFDDDTTHKVDYKKWDVQAPQFHREAEWRPPQGEMDLSTNYNTEFTPKPAQRVQQIRPASRKKTDAKFEGDTTYGQDFRKWPGDRRGLIKNDGEYQPSNAPFEGLSTYKGHYLPHQGGPAQSFKPDGNAYRSDAPFDGNTLYRTEFTPKEIEPCPAALLETQRSKYVFSQEDETGHKFYAPAGGVNRGSTILAQ